MAGRRPGRGEGLGPAGGAQPPKVPPMARLLALYRDAFRGLPREGWLLSFCLFLNRCGTMAMSFLILFLIEEHG